MKDIFDKERLPPELDANVRSMNPWWEGGARRPQPKFRRWTFEPALRKLEQGLAPATVIRGPRQVGKTTLQLQIIDHLLDVVGIEPARILRVQFDDLPSLKGVAEPILALARWFENRILKRTFNAAAQEEKPAILFLDEVQNIADWAVQLKSLVDHHSVQVFVTGSSALRIEAGRDSLAGRIAQIDMGTLLLREVAELRFGERIEPLLPFNGLEPLRNKDFWREVKNRREARAAEAFAAFSERGGYPMAQAHPDVSWPEVADQLNETVIKRAIQHDLRMGERGQKRDAQLLEEIFRLCCRYAGQAPGQAVMTQHLKQFLDANVGWQRILAYLNFLDGAMLLRMIRPLELRLKKRQGNAKLCICDHALRASWLEEFVPLDELSLRRSPHLSPLAGHLAESIAGYFLAGIPHLDIAHFPERGAEPEVDFVLTVGEQRVPVEIKYRTRVDPHADTLGLRAFVERSVNNAPFGILVTMNDNVVVDDPRIVSMTLPSLLLMR